MRFLFSQYFARTMFQNPRMNLRYFMWSQKKRFSK